MSSKRSIILLLAGIALMLAAHFAVDCSGRGSRPLERRATLCPGAFDRAKLIVVNRRGEQPLSLQRGASGWRIASPFSAAADPKAVNRLLDALSFTPISYSASESELLSMGRDRRDFSLDAPAVSVTVTGTGFERTVSIGSSTPASDGVYADVSDSDSVFVAPMSVLAAANIPAEGFRQRSLFATEPSAIVSFGVRRGKGEVTTFVHAENGWTSANGIVSSAKVKSFLADLTAAEAEGFVWPVGATNEATTASEALLSAYGLDHESAVTVTLKDAAGAETQVSFGKDAGKGLAYARVQNGTAVVTIPATLKEAADRGPSLFSDSRLFPLDARDVAAFTLTDASSQCALMRTADGAWRLESPVAAPADKTAVDEMLARILALTTADAGNEEITVAISPGTKQVAVSRKSVMGDGRMEDLRSKEAVRIDPALVRRIVRAEKTQTSSVVYDRDRRVWGVENGGEGEEVAEEQVVALLSALNPLKAERIEKLKVSAADLSTYGLDDPTLTLSIDQDREDAVRRNIIIGNQSPGGGRYATVGSSDAVFVISDRVADTLSSSVIRK